MLKGKKGIRTVLIYGILMLFLLVSFIYFFVQMSLSTEKNTTEQVCRNSIKLASYKISGTSAYKDIKCPAQYETIEAAEAEKIKYEISERMRKCWWMFHEGKLELFEEESENFCVVCYVLDFKEKKKVAGLTNYLMTHNLPMNPDMTYYDYLTPYSTTKELIDKTENTEQDFIDTNQKYAVMFNHVKPGYISKLEAGQLGAGAGGAVGVAAGALIVSYFVPGVNLFTLTGTAIAAGVGGAGAAAGFYFGQRFGDVADWAAYTVVWPYNEEEMARLQCQYAPAKTK